jgi:Peptidase family M48
LNYSRSKTILKAADMKLQKFTLLLVFALMLSACAELPANLKLSNLFKHDSAAGATAVNEQAPTAPASSPAETSSFFSQFKSAFTQEQTFNASQLSSLEQTTECKSLVTEMEITDGLAKTLGLAAKMQAVNLADQISQSIKGNGTRSEALDAQKQRLVLGLFARGLVWLPMYFEEKQGRLIQEKDQSRVLARDSTRGKQLYPIADAMLEKLTSELPASLPYSFKDKLSIMKESGKNAKALPGGYIQIDEGALRNPKDHDRAQFALAHEIAHLLQRHETKHMQAGILDGITTLQAVKQSIASYQGVDKLKQFGGVAVMMGRLHAKHGVGQELGADSCAIRIMAMAGLSDKQIRTATQQFIADHPASKGTETIQSSALSGVLELVADLQSTHPTTSERIQNLSKQLSNLAVWRTKS